MSSGRARPPGLGLRGRVMVTFVLGAGLVALVLAASVFTIAVVFWSSSAKGAP